VELVRTTAVLFYYESDTHPLTGVFVVIKVLYKTSI